MKIQQPQKPCNESAEYRFESSESLESIPITAGIRTYGGGGYIQRLTGPIQKLELKLQELIEENWIDNRTRALLVEFSVYNAQVRILQCLPKNLGFFGSL